MFTIQYEAISGSHLMQSLDSNRRDALVKHLSRFRRPIMAVYENATPITKAVREDLRHLPLNKMSQCAREFMRANS